MGRRKKKVGYHNLPGDNGGCAHNGCAHVPFDFEDPDPFAIPAEIAEAKLDAVIDKIPNEVSPVKNQFASKVLEEFETRIHSEAMEISFGDDSDVFAEEEMKTEIQKANEAVFKQVRELGAKKSTDARVRRMGDFIQAKERHRALSAFNRIQGHQCEAEVKPDYDSCLKKLDNGLRLLSELLQPSSDTSEITAELKAVEADLTEARNEIASFRSSQICGKQADFFCESCLSYFCCEQCHDQRDPNHAHDLTRTAKEFEFMPTEWVLPNDRVPVDRDVNLDRTHRCSCGHSNYERGSRVEVLDSKNSIRTFNLTYCGRCTDAHAELNDLNLFLLHDESGSANRRHAGWAVSQQVIDMLASRANENALFVPKPRNGLVQKLLSQRNKKRKSKGCPDKPLLRLPMRQQYERIVGTLLYLLVTSLQLASLIDAILFQDLDNGAALAFIIFLGIYVLWLVTMGLLALTRMCTFREFSKEESCFDDLVGCYFFGVGCMSLESCISPPVFISGVILMATNGMESVHDIFVLVGSVMPIIFMCIHWVGCCIIVKGFKYGD